MEINVNYELVDIDCQLMEAIKNNDDILIQTIIEIMN